MDPTAQTPASSDAWMARLATLEAALVSQQERIAALEFENARLRFPAIRRGRQRPRIDAGAATTADRAAPADGRTSRRGMLGAAAKVAAATVAAGVLVEQVATRPAYASGPGSFDSGTAGVPAVTAVGTNGANGVAGSSDTGVGVHATSASGDGIYGTTGSASAYGARGVNTSNSGSGIAVLGHSDDGSGGLGPGIGVQGESLGGIGVFGTADNGIGVKGFGFGGTGVLGSTFDGTAVSGVAGIGVGVYGTSAGGSLSQAMQAVGTSGSTGLQATSDTGYGVVAHSASGTGLSASSGTGSAVVASSSGVGYGLYLTAPSGWAIGCVGRIRVLGNAVGTVILTHGTITKTVSTSACSSSSNVILTPTSDPQVRIWATAAPGSFTVHASAAPSADVAFTYFLIN